MSIPFAQGFENAVTVSDLAALGLFSNTNNSANNRLGSTVSALSTGRATSGRSCVYPNTLTIAAYPGAASSGDPGYMQLPKTVNQLWTAGGFVVGFGGKFNRWSGLAALSAGSLERVGAGTPGQIAQMVNGILYTNRVTPITTANTLSYVKWNTATDKWDSVGSITPSVLTPATAHTFVMGTGEVGFANIGSTGTAVAGWVSYTTDNGSTTTAWQIGGTTIQYGGKTSGRTTDYYLFSNSSATTTPTLYTSPTLGGAVSSIILPASVNSTYITNIINITGGPDAGKTVLTSFNAGGYWYTPTTTAAANTSAAWSFANTTPIIYEVYWSASASLYVWQTASGTYTSTALGGALTSTQTALPFSQTVVFGGLRYGVWSQGRQTIHVSFDDGRTWTQAWSAANPGISNLFFTGIVTDGTYLYAMMDALGMCRSSDGFSWSFVYACEWTEAATNNVYSPIGVMFTTQSSTTTHALNTSATTPAFGMVFNASSSGATTRSGQLRGPTLNSAAANLATFTASCPVSASGTWHYYEFEFTPTATGNTFTVRFWIDGTLTYDSGTTGYLCASSTSDTTTYPFFNTGRNAAVTGFDDILLIVKDGVGTSAPIGGASILPRRVTADVGVPAWTRNPANLGSNAAAVNSGGLSTANAVNGASAVVARRVSTDTDGARDEYSSTSAVAAQGLVLGVMTEAFYTKTSGTQAVVNQGLSYGGVDALTTQTITTSTATYTQTINEKAPGGAAWSTAAADGCTFVQVKVS